jgi:hypothetical protein
MRSRLGGTLRLYDDPSPNSPHQPCRRPAIAPAPKWSHRALVLHIKHALRGDWRDICDYIKADQIDELFRRDVEERTRREREHGRMARSALARNCPTLMRIPYPFVVLERAGPQGLTPDMFIVPLNESVLRAPTTAVLGGYRHDLPLIVFLSRRVVSYR